MKGSLIFFILVFCTIGGFSQGKNDTLLNVNFYHENQKIIIKYDLISSNSKDSFFIDLKIYNSKDSLFLPRKLSGDYQKVVAGNGKTIIWNVGEEEINIDEEIQIKLSAKHQIQINKSKHILKSILLPGLGDYRIRNGKLHFLAGVFAYGSVGSSIYFNSEAINEYESYKNEYELEKSKMLYDRAKLDRNISLISAGLATTIWVLDYSLLNLRIKKVKKKIEKSKYYFDLQNHYINVITPKKHINTKSQFVLAIEKGDDFIKSKDYKNALTNYLIANDLAIKNSEKISVSEKIKTTKTLIEEENKINSAFLVCIQKGDKLLSEKQLDESKKEYQKALELKPKDNYSIQKINEIELLISQNNIQLKYNSLITEGNELIQSGDYKLALIKFEQALLLKPTEKYPMAQITICDKQIALLEKQKIQKEFDINLASANALIAQRKFELAIEKLNQCSNLIPSNTSIQNKIDFCNEEIQKIEIQKSNNLYKELITKADNAWDNKMYQDALNFYREATAIKPLEKYPLDRIQKIEEKLNANVEANSGSIMTSVYEKSKNAVFYVDTPEGSGTGFFVSSSGIAISCYHVFENVEISKCKVILINKLEYQIDKVLEKNKEKDYIIFTVKKSKNNSFQFLPVSYSSPKPLEDVLSIGFPDGFFTPFPENGKVNTVEDDLIFHNANITYGNSGGPLINAKGEVIGINAGGITPNAKEYKYAISIISLNLRRYL
jgi:serine protease Do